VPEGLPVQHTGHAVMQLAADLVHSFGTLVRSFTSLSASPFSRPMAMVRTCWEQQGTDGGTSQWLQWLFSFNFGLRFKQQQPSWNTSRGSVSDGFRIETLKISLAC